LGGPRPSKTQGVPPLIIATGCNDGAEGDIMERKRRQGVKKPLMIRH
jgi:hypothetical protein